MSTTPPLTYSSAVTGVHEICYGKKPTDSKWVAPEIRGSAAQIRSKTTINDKRRGASRVEPQDGPSERLPSRATRVTHRVTLTPLPGTAPAANRSQQQPVRGPDAPSHTSQADIRYFPSGRPLPHAHALLCMLQSDPFLVPGANDTTPSATSAQAPTFQEPAASANPRSCNKTTAKWAQKTTHATEGDLLPPQAGDTHIAHTLAGLKSVNKMVAK